MDGSTAVQRRQVDVEAVVRDIRAHMPQTYQVIQARAQQLGREVYSRVRRAIAGQPDTFYAIERGWVVGTPFSAPDIARDVAQTMVTFGSISVVIWGLQDEPEAVADGAH